MCVITFHKIILTSFTEVRFPFQQCKYITCPAFENELKVEMKQLTWDQPSFQVYNKHKKYSNSKICFFPFKVSDDGQFKLETERLPK